MTAQNQDLFYIDNDKVILKAQGEFPEREIGVIKSTEEESIQYFTERYQKLAEKVQKLSQQIQEQDNKGSFLQKVINFREELKNYDGIGDYTALEDELKNHQLMLEDYIRQNRIRNLEVKNTLIEEAKSYAANPNWKEATEQLKELRQRWIKIGAVDQEQKEEVESNFQAVYDDFYNRKKAFHDARMAMMNSRLDQYKHLIEKASKIQSDKKMKSEEKKSQLNSLMDEWKSLENIPKDSYDSLLKQFKKFTSHVKSKKSGVSKSNSKEAEKKRREIIEAIKVARDLPSDQAVGEAKKLQAEWKNAGKASLPKELVDEYFYTTDYIFEKDFIEKLFSKKIKKDSEQKAALKIKMNIVRDLISRDKKELLIFEENIGKFTLETAKIDKMVSSKFDKQKRKLAVKQDILSELQEEYKKL